MILGRWVSGRGREVDAGGVGDGEVITVGPPGPPGPAAKGGSEIGRGGRCLTTPISAMVNVFPFSCFTLTLSPRWCSDSGEPRPDSDSPEASF